MVHALEKSGSFLRPGGCILVIHDLVDPPRIEVHAPEGEFYAGQLLSNTGFENQRMADQAVDQAVQKGVFLSTQVQIFENYMRADSLASMDAWLAEDWESAYLTEGTRMEVEQLVDRLGAEAEVVLHLISRITRLDPIKTNN
ncbi:MAG: hypothetical protein ACK2UM_12425 [Anaerolineales bacterium]|jgi:hypothetical protein